MGTRKGQIRKTARRAYEPKKKKKKNLRKVNDLTDYIFYQGPNLKSGDFIDWSKFGKNKK